MDRAALDAAYNNGAAVKESARIVAGWQARSERIRAKHRDGLDLRYGPAERNRIDFFEARKDAPVLVFIHGGYWQNRAKELFAFLVPGPLAHGISVALVGYTLAPEKRLEGIVGEIRAAIQYLDSRGNRMLSLKNPWSLPTARTSSPSSAGSRRRTRRRSSRRSCCACPATTTSPSSRSWPRPTAR